MTAPTIAVEVAFGTDPFTTPGTWTDITAYVREFEPSRGKTHELDQTQAGTATVRLKNNDRRFDPTYTSSPYYPNVIPMRRLRIRATHNAITYDLFQGFVEDWGQSYIPRPISGTGGAETVVKVVDAFNLLALYDLTAYSTEVLADEPVAYWKLDEAPGTRPLVSIGSVSGVDGTYENDDVFPGALVNPLVGGATATEFNHSVSSLGLQIANVQDMHIPGDLTLEMWLRKPSTLTLQGVITDDAVATSGPTYELGFSSTGEGVFSYKRKGSGSGIGFEQVLFSQAGFVVQDVWQHIAVVRQGRTLSWYRNGSLFDTTELPSLAAAAGSTIAMGLANFLPDYREFFGELAHVAIYDKALFGARIWAHYQATFDTFVEQGSGSHIDNILDLVGWPAGERALDTGTSVVKAIVPSGNALTWLLQVGETTERGLFRVQGNGKITFDERSDQLIEVSAATFGDSGAEIAYDTIGLRYDDQDLYSTVRVSSDTEAAHTATDSGAATTYGPRTLDLSGNLTADVNELDDEANYLLSRYKAPALRIESIGFTDATDDATFVQLLGRDVGDKITVKRRPPGGGTITQVSIIEQIALHWAAGAPWTAEWSLIPADPNTYWVLNTSALNTSTILGY